MRCSCDDDTSDILPYDYYGRCQYKPRIGEICFLSLGYRHFLEMGLMNVDDMFV